jgi:DNA ligase D-like protein (predicted 3'-phosphoesterase)
MSTPHAIRAVVRGRVQAVGFRDAAVRRAHELGLLGWVRNGEEGEVLVHAEGPPDAVARLEEFLRKGPPAAIVEEVVVEPVKAEGHEQFAIRGVPAGAFVVEPDPFVLRLEVEGAMRSWAVPKGPSMDPAAKRLAIELPAAAPSGPAVDALWDHGHYEQGGRVPWPEALERGHAVFVLHGRKLQGGFALQRTNRAGTSGAPQWLLVKRRDEHARPG